LHRRVDELEIPPPSFIPSTRFPCFREAVGSGKKKRGETPRDKPSQSRYAAAVDDGEKRRKEKSIIFLLSTKM
jgi:hypothetical protein